MEPEFFANIFLMGITGGVFAFLAAAVFFHVAMETRDRSRERTFFFCFIVSIVLSGASFVWAGLHQTHIRKIDGVWHACRRENGQVMCRPTESTVLINENGEVFECRCVDGEMMCVFKNRVEPGLMEPEVVTPDENR